MDADRSRQLAEFVAYAQSLRGDEKGEAQVFLDRLFRAFSRRGYKEAGATLEERIKNDRGGTAFADLVWKPLVLVEMKKRGEDLSRHLTQAFDYWVRLVPGRPRYVILCNFDEFRIYDFDVNINDPLDIVTLAELPNRYGPLNFFWPTDERPVFGVDREGVTRKAADKLAAIYRALKARKNVGPDTAQRFVLQCLVCFFSEDIGLLPRNFFTTLLQDCTDPPKAFDLLDGLFRAMNQREGTRGGRYRDVAYFNGGLFAHSAAVEIDPAAEGTWLREAATYNWSHVSPDIFGTIFQHSLDAGERHAFGAHYTSPTDIMKIVKPTIVDPWSTAIDRADTLKELAALRARLQSLRVLDPACGSGNFLYIAYREMRRLEAAILTRENELSKRQATGQMALGGLSPRQFFGLDILPFAVELAKVTLSLAPKLASDELHTTERTLPLDNLDNNIVRRDALIDNDGQPARWPVADVIIGNPPFLDARKMTMELGRNYVSRLESQYPEIARRADHCVYWFRRAHDHLKPATATDPFSGRAGLVGTQNIRNNEAREAGLDHVVKSGTIVEAVENQPWSGEANVHVSIANWVKTEGEKDESALLIPSPRRLWSKVDPSLPLFQTEDEASRPKVVTKGKRGQTRKDKSYELALRSCDFINSALSDATDLSGARILACNRTPKAVFEGVQTGHDGFVIQAAEANTLLARRKAYRPYLKPFINGTDLLTGEHAQRPEYVVDLTGLDMLAASALPDLIAIPKQRVLADWAKDAEREHMETGRDTGEHQGRMENWWWLKRPRLDLQRTIAKLRRYIACSAVMKRPTFVFLSSEFLPTNALKVFAFSDDYSFGILQSDAHWQWFIAKCSKLKSDFRYTPESVFDTFPWPQSPTARQVRAVAAAGVEIRNLRALYRTLELPGRNPLKDAHAALDAAVLDAYGFSPRKDLLKQLLDLNLAVAARLDRHETVTAPGIPPTIKDPAPLITDDCIRP